MTKNLEALNPQPKTGQEHFTFDNSPVNIKLIDFWQWSQSDLVSNATRGILAEFIVASALELDLMVRREWDAIDFKTKKGLKIEVKSSAYLQSWYQDKLSKIIFDIAPTTGWCAETNTYSPEKKRHADIYIFCLLHHKDKQTVDPKNQKKLSLPGLLKLDALECTFPEIKPAVETFEKKYCQ
jgi:hypothetical protein